MAQEYPSEFVERVNAIKGKRPRTVVQHILEHGHITTDDLTTLYGYMHPPRAARDVREEGIPLETFKMNVKGRRIGAYRFGDPADVVVGRQGGRKAWPQKFRNEMTQRYGSRCGVCNATYADSHLQIDHRVPYQVGGDPSDLNPSDFMLVCGSCNRAKSWSCEHCHNWSHDRDIGLCRTCYWGSPTQYAHIALQPERRLDIVWTGKPETDLHDRLERLSRHAQQRLPEFVKAVLRKHVEDDTASI